MKKPRFKDNGNGTVTDNLTKLIWLKDANAFGLRTWEQAMLDANTLASGFHGLTDNSKAGDWRLPTVKELQSLIDFAYLKPALSDAMGTGKWISGDAFIGVQSFNYWSGTPLIYSTGHVQLNDGYVRFGNKTNTFYVWPVRTEQ